MFLSCEVLVEPSVPSHPPALATLVPTCPFQHPSRAGPEQLPKCPTPFWGISQLIGRKIYVQGERLLMAEGIL